MPPVSNSASMNSASVITDADFDGSNWYSSYFWLLTVCFWTFERGLGVILEREERQL